MSILNTPSACANAAWTALRNADSDRLRRQRQALHIGDHVGRIGTQQRIVEALDLDSREMRGEDLRAVRGVQAQRGRVATGTASCASWRMLPTLLSAASTLPPGRVMRRSSRTPPPDRASDLAPQLPGPAADIGHTRLCGRLHPLQHPWRPVRPAVSGMQRHPAAEPVVAPYWR
ncbi:hypothetical protein [Xanthomonas translucens]|uniref:hypothetical protein n=1 Tax=Xanthomonas campestris pv. translucens TaxID=343 RepID=UPI001F60A578|nr:hypothetical protein [Xanthomonas translucens]UNU09836.1 hypothetical protein KBV71_10825 [Xanthomonas translucens pv. translucens]